MEAQSDFGLGLTMFRQEQGPGALPHDASSSRCSLHESHTKHLRSCNQNQPVIQRGGGVTAQSKAVVQKVLYKT